jgi:hypothetical protein
MGNSFVLSTTSGRLHLEHDIVRDSLQVAYEPDAALPPRVF